MRPNVALWRSPRKGVIAGRAGEALNQIEPAVRQSGDDALRLAELLAVRLCHDLSGPLGTLMGALELINEDPATAAEALPLAGEVATSLGRRLRLLRAAWGGATGAMSVDEFAALAEGVQLRRGRIDLEGLDPAARFSSAAARVALNAVLLAVEAMPGGGTAAFSGNPASDILVTVSGPRAAWPAGFIACVSDPALARQAMRDGDDGQASRGLQGPLTVLIAEAASVRLSLLMALVAEAVPTLLMNFTGR
jgi:histidine phosphotransferase ChpT